MNNPNLIHIRCFPLLYVRGIVLQYFPYFLYCYLHNTVTFTLNENSWIQLPAWLLNCWQFSWPDGVSMEKCESLSVPLQSSWLLLTQQVKDTIKQYKFHLFSLLLYNPFYFSFFHSSRTLSVLLFQVTRFFSQLGSAVACN